MPWTLVRAFDPDRLRRMPATEFPEMTLRDWTTPSAAPSAASSPPIRVSNGPPDPLTLTPPPTVVSELRSMALANLENHFGDAKSDRLDGLRLDWTHADGRGSWLLVRASNTEPIVRIIAEAPTAEEAHWLCDEAASVIRKNE